MSAPSHQTQTWYLLKHGDNSIYGPASFEQLRAWALEAQVSPLDKVSTDQTNWQRAPMLPELGMDWLVEVTPEHCYGPTTLGSVRDFFLRGEIGPETVLINACDHTRHHVADIPELMEPPPGEEEVGRGPAPGSSDTEGELAPNPAVGDSPNAEDAAAPTEATAGSSQPDRAGLRFSLQQRIRELEGSLLEERRLLTALSQRYAELESKYVTLLGHQRAVSNARMEGPSVPFPPM